MTVIATDDAAEEGPDPGTFTVSRTGPTAGPLTVFYSMTGAARNGIDYETIGTSVTIPSGAATATVTITPIDDAETEGTESAVLTLTADAAYVVGAPGIASVTIADNDLPEVTVVATDPDASETGPDPGVFTFTRSGGNLGAALPVLVARGGSAANGLDYASIGGGSLLVIIPANDTTATVTMHPWTMRRRRGRRPLSSP